ncbi:hypothetical protein V2G26_006551 [Clonostachys chloroleuca]
MLVTVGGKGSVTLRRLVGLQRILLVQGRGNEPRVEIYAGDESLWPGSTKSVHVISGWYRAPRTSPQGFTQDATVIMPAALLMCPIVPRKAAITAWEAVHWVWAMYGEHCVSHRLRHLALTFAWSFGCWEPLEHPDVAMPSLEQVLAAARLM